jgi:hypothetical protein
MLSATFFGYTARARDYRSSLRIRHQRCLQCQHRKETRLDEAEHRKSIRQCRIRSSREVPAKRWLAFVRLRAARFGSREELGSRTSMDHYIAPHTAKIHTLITLGISFRRKPLVL